MSVRDAILNALDANPDLILDLASEFPANMRGAHLVPGKWSALEQLGHLARVETMMAGRLDGILMTPDQQVSPYDPDLDNPDSLRDEDWGIVATRYRTSRSELVSKLRAVNDASWHRPVVHPEYPQYSLHVMTRHLAMHDAFHGYRIEELLSLTLAT